MLEGDEKSERLENNGVGDSVCRDYVRGVCGRKFCKFKHEKEVRNLSFCHDFQNTACPRPSCKFIHCSADEEEEYKNTGEMSSQILAEATRKFQLPGAQPVCNQFRKGACRRTTCKFRHITKEEEESEIKDIMHTNARMGLVPPFPLGPPTLSNGNSKLFAAAAAVNSFLGARADSLIDDCSDFGPPLAKRRFMAADLDYMEAEAQKRRAFFKGYFAGNPPMLSGVDARTIMVEDENSLLHKEIAQLKKQVSDLTATNEFLLDQNATLRMTGKHNATVSVPAVTITNTQPQQVIRTVTASVATVPVSIAAVSTGTPVSGIAGCPAVSIAPTAQMLAPSQQILVTTNPSSQIALAGNSQPQQLVLASAPQQLTSQGQQLALASNNQHLTSQAQLGQQLTNQAQQLALANTSQQLAVTSVPQQLTLASTGQQLQQLEMHRNAINTSQAIAMSNATQPMVSYPIMTQTMTHPLSH